MKRISVRARLLFALAALTLATFLVGAIAWAVLERTTSRVDRLHGDTLSSVDAAMTLSRQAAAIATNAPYLLLLDSPFRIAQEGEETVTVIDEIAAGLAEGDPLAETLADMRTATLEMVSDMQARAGYRDQTLRTNATLAKAERRFAQLAASTDTPLAERQDWFALQRLADALLGAGRAENLIGVGEFQRSYHHLRRVANTDGMREGHDDLAELRTLAEGREGLFELRRLELMHQIGAQGALVRVRLGAAAVIAHAEAVTAGAQTAIAAERAETTSAIALRKSTILVVVLASAALALSAALYVSGYVTGNLRAVSDGMMRLAAGDRSLRLSRGEGAGDEIGKLFHAFRTFRANAIRLDRSNRRLAERNALFEKMMSGITDGVAILSDTGTIIARNDRLAQVLRLDPAMDIKRVGLDELVAKGGWKETPGPTGIQMLATDDGHFAVRRESPLPGGGAVVLIADITEQRQIDDRMQQIRRIEALGKVTGEVAHDFGNILSTINGSLHLMETASPDVQRELVGSIANAAEIGTALVQRLLAFARRQKLMPEVVELNALIEGMADLVAMALREEIHLETRVAPEAIDVCVDPGQLESALLNLCLNSAQAIDGAGAITISVATDGDRAVIEVSDTGCGMSAETVEHAMEPFYTARADGTGTGLGFAMVYGFISQSGGEVQILSAPGAGTTVRMSLPRANPVISPGVHWDRVLIVEDDPKDLAAARAILKDHAARIVEETTTDGALARLDAQSFDLVVSDLSLGGSPGGWRIASAALSSGAARSVAIVSGRLPATTPFNGQYGASLVTLTKPFDIATLHAALGKDTTHDRA
ncbi:signal transduction histidine kinase [Aliiruegeria haliotis]|uniref:histidine kinase n=1 Tax=Aliiruegeria haliotis TaxID=1280846 RepID=A0A2T0RID7_9RHOB|nr:ATP-binding protein [Aliiruegeria haliotis]PRY20860.1 signal transduction histidine kinase [Aliiruegeria haliotis]